MIVQASKIIDNSLLQKLIFTIPQQQESLCNIVFFLCAMFLLVIIIGLYCKAPFASAEQLVDEEKKQSGVIYFASLPLYFLSMGFCKDAGKVSRKEAKKQRSNVTF